MIKLQGFLSCFFVSILFCEHTLATDVAPQGFRYKNSWSGITSSSNFNAVTHDAEVCHQSGLTPETIVPLSYSAYSQSGIESAQMALCFPRKIGLPQRFYIYASSYCPDGFNVEGMDPGSYFPSYICRSPSPCSSSKTLIPPKGCHKTNKQAGPASCAVQAQSSPNTSYSNPINVSNGMKWGTAIDLDVRNLKFVRTYNSYTNPDRPSYPVGVNWTHTYDRRVVAGNSTGNWVKILRPGGEEFIYSLQSFEIDYENQVTHFVGPRWTPEQGVYGTLVTLESQHEFPNGWKYSSGNGEQEYYNSDGLLVRIQNKSGQITNLSYSSNLDLTQVQSLGKALTFSYNASGAIATLQLDSAIIAQYSYDSLGNLTQVEDSTGTQVTYLYGNDDFPHALTGTVDEKGVGYQNWGYDQLGRAILSWHANDLDKTTITYNDDNTVLIENPLGKLSKLVFQQVSGSNKLVQKIGYQSPNCSEAIQEYTYYGEDHPNFGQISTKTDWEGVITRFEYNDKGLQTKKTEAEGTPQERITLTEWHVDFNVPTKVTTPTEITEHTYDTNGRLLTTTTTTVAP